MTWLPLTLAVVGLTGLTLALISEPMQRRLPVTEPLVALVLGVLAGPAVLGLVTVEDHVRDRTVTPPRRRSVCSPCLPRAEGVLDQDPPRLVTAGLPRLGDADPAGL